MGLVFFGKNMPRCIPICIDTSINPKWEADKCISLLIAIPEFILRNENVYSDIIMPLIISKIIVIKSNIFIMVLKILYGV